MPPRSYNNVDMLRMQREAELRVREMRNRARSVAQEGELPLPPDNHNWSTATGRSRQLPSQPLRPPQPLPRRIPPQETPIPLKREAIVEKIMEPSPVQQELSSQQKTDGTLLGDLLGSTGIGEDTLLIIGLILILMNQKADTTLLLALGYLLLPENLF